MSKSPSFQMLVPKISRIAPLKSVIYVGEREAGAIQKCLSENSLSLIFACHKVEDAQGTGQGRDTQGSSDNPNLHHILCSKSVGVKPYYETSLRSESGLTDPVYLKKYWKNISAKSEVEREVTTLDDYFLNPVSASVTADDLNWLVVDMLSSGDVILGARKLLEKIDCVVVKTLFDNAADEHLENSTFAGVSKIFTEQGFIFYDEVRHINPNIGYSFFLKDWKRVASALDKDNARLNIVHEEAVTSIKQLVSVNNELEVERDNLDEAHKTTIMSLTELDETYGALKAERDNLEAARRESEMLVEQGEAATAALKAEYEALKTTHEDTVSSLTQLEEGYGAVQAERDNLQIAHRELEMLVEQGGAATAALKDECKALKTTHKDTISSLAQLEVTYNAIQAERDNLEVANRELEMLVEQGEAATTALKGECEGLKTKQKDYVSSLTQLEQACSAAKAERDNLQVAHRESEMLIEQGEADNAALKNECEALQATHKDTVSSLTQLEEAHNAVKAERDSLSAAHNEALINIASLNEAVTELRYNKNTVDALTPEFNKLKDELMALREGYSATDEVDNLSKNLEDATKSLKISTQLQLKKEIDYKDLENKYADLVKMTDAGKAEKVAALTHKDPIRIIHHLSCTGGTLFAKCLAAQPNTLLLNEVDPLSTILVNTKKAEFTPTDLIGLMRQADAQADQEVLADVFLDGLKVVKRHLTSKAITLIGRDHSHGKYLTGDVVKDRPSFKDIVSREYDVISLVTVRHPIDSYLSLQKNGWDQHFSPSTLDEYCKRYLRFLDDMSNADVIRYEDFIDDPKGVMRQMCLILKISYNDSFVDIFDTFSFSGDSGRSAGSISKRARRDINDEILAEVDNSKAYAAVIKRLGY